MAVKYLDEVEEVFKSLWSLAIKELEDEHKKHSFPRADFIKYMVEIMNNIVENAAKYPLTLKQIELIEKQIDEADKLLDEKQALIKAQIKGELAKAMLILRQTVIYDDNILEKTCEIIGNTIGMVNAGEGLVDTDQWQQFANALGEYKAKTKADDPRFAQLIDKINTLVTL